MLDGVRSRGLVSASHKACYGSAPSGWSLPASSLRKGSKMRTLIGRLPAGKPYRYASLSCLGVCGPELLSMTVRTCSAYRGSFPGGGSTEPSGGV